MSTYDGTLSGWKEITTRDQDEPSAPSSNHTFTLPELYALLRKLRNLFDPEYVSRIEDLIAKHVADHNNPHQTDLKQLGTDVLNELYKCWLAQGNSGGQDLFLKILFQYVRIADIDVTRAGQALDQVPSVRAVATVMNDHNTHPDAHEVMFAKLFPGSQFNFEPSFALQAYAGVSRGVRVERASDCAYIGADGRLHFAPPHTLAVDHQFGEAMFAIWDRVVNQVQKSEDLGDARFWARRYLNLDWDSNVLNPTGLPGCFRLIEDSSPGAQDHVMGWAGANGGPYPADTAFTISMMVKPAGRPCLGIRLMPEIFGEYGYVHFHLTEQKVFISDAVDKSRLIGGIVPMANDWYRCYLTCRPPVPYGRYFEFYPIDIYDGDRFYQGDGMSGLYAAAVQVNDGADLPPYVRSTAGEPGVMEATYVTIPLGNWYNPLEGTLVVRGLNADPIQGAHTKELYTIGQGAAQGALNGRVPTNHNGRFFFAAYDEANVSLLGQWSAARADRYLSVVHAYSPSQQLIGVPGNVVVTTPNRRVNPNVDTLYFGCDRYKQNTFRGYIKDLAYYPRMCTPQNANFFLGE